MTFSTPQIRQFALGVDVRRSVGGFVLLRPMNVQVWTRTACPPKPKARVVLPPRQSAQVTLPPLPLPKQPPPPQRKQPEPPSNPPGTMVKSRPKPPDVFVDVGGLLQAKDPSPADECTSSGSAAATIEIPIRHNSSTLHGDAVAATKHETRNVVAATKHEQEEDDDVFLVEPKRQKLEEQLHDVGDGIAKPVDTDLFAADDFEAASVKSDVTDGDEAVVVSDPYM